LGLTPVSAIVYLHDWIGTDDIEVEWDLLALEGRGFKVRVDY